MRTGQLLSIAVLVCGLQGAVLAQRSTPNQQNSGPPTVTGVLSVKNYAAIRDSLGYLADVGGQPQLTQMLDGVISAFTGGHGLLGIDRKKPLGVALLSHGGQTAWPLVFIPISDQEKALQLLHAVGPLIMRKFGPMPYKLTNKWFLIGPALDHIHEKHVPNPSRLIDAEALKYDLAFTSNVQEIPMVAVENAFKKIDELANHPALGRSLSYRQGQLFGATMVKSIGQLVLSGAKQITLGINVAPKRKKLAIELALETRRATELSRLLESLTRNPSHLAGLVDPAGLVSCMLNVPLSTRARNQLLSVIPSGRPDRGPGPALLNTAGGDEVTAEQQLLSLFRKTVENGRLEVAFSLRGNPPGPLTVVGSAVLSDAKDIESFLIRQIEIDEKSNRLKFSREVTRFRTVPIHELEVPMLKGYRKFFGPRPKVHFAATSDMVHFAIGGLSLDSMRWAIDRTNGTRRYSNRFSPFVVQARLQPWLSLVSKPGLGALRRHVSPSERVTFIVTPTANSLRARLEIQEGLLRLIGSQASAGPSGFSPRRGR